MFCNDSLPMAVLMILLLKANAGIAVLRGNLAPNGCVIKPSAASKHLMKHRGRVRMRTRAVAAPRVCGAWG